MTTTIEHVRHRVTDEQGALLIRGGSVPLRFTSCGRRFVPSQGRDHNARHHEPRHVAMRGVLPVTDEQGPDRPPTPLITATRWRRELAEHVLEELLPVINSPNGTTITHGTGTVQEVDAPYALVWAMVDDDGVMVGWGGRPLTRDLKRIAGALEDIADPERARRRTEWQEREAAQLAAYAALPFPCQRGAYHCQKRFATERGLRSHLAAAERDARRGQDWQHRCGMAGTEPCEHKRPDPDAPPPERPRPSLTVIAPGSAEVER